MEKIEEHLENERNKIDRLLDERDELINEREIEEKKSKEIDDLYDYYDELRKDLGGIERYIIGIQRKISKLVIRSFDNEYCSDSNPDAPKGFTSLVAKASNKIFAYSTSPVEQSQRISTLARAARSLELGLAAAVNLPVKGVGASANLQSLRSAVGAIEAVERAPILVGFSDRQTEEECGNGCRRRKPQFGWVFGPKVRIDPENQRLELVQTVSAHKLFADISIPAWWTRIRMELETAWIGNWHENGEIINSPEGFLDWDERHREQFDVLLPSDDQSFVALTTYLVSNTIGPDADLISVESVTPQTISACAEKVTFIVEGINIWRSTEAYFGGIPGDIKVLPGMKGISATFDFSNFDNKKYVGQAFGQAVQPVDLSIWSRNGTAIERIAVVGARSKKSCASSIALPPATEYGPAIESLAPGEVPHCAAAATFVISGWSLLERRRELLGRHPTVLLDGVAADAIEILAEGYPELLKVTFNAQTTPTMEAAGQASLTMNPVAGTVTMTVANSYGVTSAPIRLVSCDEARPKPALTPVLTVHENHVIATTKTNGRKEFLLHLRVSGAKTADLTKLKMAVLLSKGADKVWVSAASPLEAKADILTARFELDPSEYNTLGQPLKLRVALIQDDKPKFEAKNQFVYYPDEAAANPSINKPDGEQPDIPGEIQLKLPKHWHDAFPGLRIASVKLSIEGQEGIKLAPAVSKIEIAKDDEIVTVSQIKVADVLSSQEWEKVHREGPQKLLVNIEGEAKKGVPKATMLKITIKKKG